MTGHALPKRPLLDRLARLFLLVVLVFWCGALVALVLIATPEPNVPSFAIEAGSPGLH